MFSIAARLSRAISSVSRDLTTLAVEFDMLAKTLEKIAGIGSQSNQHPIQPPIQPPTNHSQNEIADVKPLSGSVKEDADKIFGDTYVGPATNVDGKKKVRSHLSGKMVTVDELSEEIREHTFNKSVRDVDIFINASYELPFDGFKDIVSDSYHFGWTALPSSATLRSIKILAEFFRLEPIDNIHEIFPREYRSALMEALAHDAHSANVGAIEELEKKIVNFTGKYPKTRATIFDF